jgi:hypothetical protein
MVNLWHDGCFIHIRLGCMGSTGLGLALGVAKTTEPIPVYTFTFLILKEDDNEKFNFSACKFCP